jgi:small subunit ribosomal protein S3
MLVGDIKIYKTTDNKFIVDIFTAKPGLVNGENGENLSALVAKLTKKFGFEFSANVKEIKSPETNAVLVADSIARQIEKRMPYKRVIKQAIQRANEKGAK